MSRPRMKPALCNKSNTHGHVTLIRGHVADIYLLEKLIHIITDHMIAKT